MQFISEYASLYGINYGIETTSGMSAIAHGLDTSIISSGKIKVYRLFDSELYCDSTTEMDYIQKIYLDKVTTE